MSTSLIKERTYFNKLLYERNKNVRDRFQKYYADNYEPKYRLVAEAMGLGYINFRRFATNRHDYAEDSLERVENFLDEQGY
ncbi:hypothetical protein LOY18_12005 [Staphylococcus capitis]|uniref:hypothetical protein n=1 Tax=Staphylococcus capitis TaxID=29388 RepID=UPI001E5D794D|nr:hypothetical protein [Staphylococcus capitis]MCC9117505.1 hypothetical protein [Staphylococcus capitis]MCC9143969.1 hypothetical protein [Staphylococcus capitis]